MKTIIYNAITMIVLATVTGFANAGAPAKNPKAPDPVAPPVDDSLGFSLTAGYDSDYVFRGFNFGQHLVSAGLSAPIKLTDKLTFTFAPWYGNIADNNTKFDELDLVTGFTYDLGFATIGAGYTYYYFPFSGFGTHEPNVSITSCLCTLGGCDINVFGGAFADLSANAGGTGWYYETGVNTSIKITDWLSLVPETRVSYASNYYGQDGMNNVLVKLGAPITLNKAATLTPYVANSFALNGLDPVGQGDVFFGGVSLTVTF